MMGSKIEFTSIGSDCRVLWVGGKRIGVLTRRKCVAGWRWEADRDLQRWLGGGGRWQFARMESARAAIRLRAQERAGEATS